MGTTVKDSSPTWVILEIAVDAADTSQRLINSSVLVDKFTAHVPGSNTSPVMIAPGSGVNVGSGIGYLLVTQATGAVSGFAVVESSPLSIHGNEDLRDWFVQSAGTGEPARCIVTARRRY